MRHKHAFMYAGAALALAAGAVAIAAPPAFACGWLWAFVFLSMIPIGSLALLLVGGITGGRWVGELSPVLVPAARAMPLFAIAFLPVLLWRSSLYHWSAPPEVTRLYLNPPFFAVRSLAGLVLWSIMAWRRTWTTPLGAGLGLTLHGVLLTFLPADWMLTLAPGSDSAGFGFGFGVEQILAALGFAALLAPQGNAPRASRDLAGLLLSALLGTVYFFYMQFIITWYGNIPDKVAWFALRAAAPWPPLFIAAFVLGAILPFLAVLHPALRSRPMPLRALGALVVCGVGLHVAWLILPAHGPAAAMPMLLSAAAIGLAALAARPLLLPARLRHG